jgi:hypothetical protein
LDLLLSCQAPILIDRGKAFAPFKKTDKILNQNALLDLLIA